MSAHAAALDEPARGRRNARGGRSGVAARAGEAGQGACWGFPLATDGRKAALQQPRLWPARSCAARHADPPPSKPAHPLRAAPQVLKRSGTEAEKRCAARIIPVIANEHFLLVTLLLCNAAANEVGGTARRGRAPRLPPPGGERGGPLPLGPLVLRPLVSERRPCTRGAALRTHTNQPGAPPPSPGFPQALPLFLDRLADPLTAVLLSTSVVLVFGEVLPQALCSRYGLQVRALRRRRPGRLVQSGVRRLRLGPGPGLGAGRPWEGGWTALPPACCNVAAVWARAGQ